jgi:hypothetical protein
LLRLQKEILGRRKDGLLRWGQDAARVGIGEAVRDYAVAFFVDDGLVAARCPEWLQSSFTILITLLECIGLKASASKTKLMMCLPEKMRVAKMEEEYAAQQPWDTAAVQ